MKNHENCLHILFLVILLLFFSAVAYAQSANDATRDLSVTFSSRHAGEEPGYVFGVVRNNSTNAYRCVHIEFDLYTRFDMRPPGQEGRHLGVLPIEVKEIQPREVKDYKHQLPFPAGIGLKSVSSCREESSAHSGKALPDAPEIFSFTVVPQRIQAGEAATLRWRTANADQVFVGEANPAWPHGTLEPIRGRRRIESSGSLQVQPSQTVKYTLEAKKGGTSTLKDVTVEVTSPPMQAATCSITGRLYGKLRWDVKDDRGQPLSLEVTHMHMTTPGAARPVGAQVRGQAYEFSHVPAGKTYKIFPGKFRSEPGERTVRCQPNITHGEMDFKITGAPRLE